MMERGFKCTTCGNTRSFSIKSNGTMKWSEELKDFITNSKVTITCLECKIKVSETRSSFGSLEIKDTKSMMAYG